MRRRLAIAVWLLGALMYFAGTAQAQPAKGDDPPAQEQSTEATDAEEKDTSSIEDLPKLEDMVIPSTDDLLLKEPRTWIILMAERVIVCGGIRPRPNTLATLEKQIEDLQALPAPASKAEREARSEQFKRLRYIRGTLPGPWENPEFELETRLIKEIWHHEDLLLKRAQLQMDAGDLRGAYELLLALDRADDDWPGLDEGMQRLLFLDANFQNERDRPQFALARLEELFDRNSEYPELATVIGQTTDHLIHAAVEADDFRQARYFIDRLKRRIASHPVVLRWVADLESRMAAHVQAARDAAGRADYSLATREVDEAARIWPHSGSLRELHRQLKRRYQRLIAGVSMSAGAKHAFPFATDSDERREQLVSRPLFEVYSCEDVPRYRTAWFENWEPTELGRNLVLDLRSRREYWNPQPDLTASDLLGAFSQRLHRGHGTYDERFAGYVNRVIARNPYQLEFEFARVPLRPEAILSGSVSGLEQSEKKMGRIVGFFRPAESRPGESVFVRVQPEPEDSPLYHVAEVVERSYPNDAELLRGAFRNEVNFLPRLPFDALETFNQDVEWQVKSYALPVVHLLQFHPKSLPARNQEFRRALYFALDRDRIMKEAILRGAPDQYARLTSAPYPSQLYAFQLGIVQPEPDLRVALSLALAAKKAEEGNLPEFVMVCEPDPAMRRAAEEMILRWRRIGLRVKLADNDAEIERWDIAYRNVTLTEPLTQLWPLLTQYPIARVEDLQVLPGWLRQQLIDLEMTTNWEDAIKLLKSIHTDLWAEMFVVPLWEVDRFMAHHRTIAEVPDLPVRCYQNLESWTIEPWYDQRDP